MAEDVDHSREERAPNGERETDDETRASHSSREPASSRASQRSTRPSSGARSSDQARTRDDLKSSDGAARESDDGGARRAALDARSPSDSTRASDGPTSAGAAQRTSADSEASDHSADASQTPSSDDAVREEVEEPEREQELESAFPIVGIGASAGGVEAVTSLVRVLPDDTGMAFVVVLHLDPRHESQLAEILARVTNLPVRTAEHGMAIEQNSVYVIPPAKDLTVEHGVLQLGPRTESRGQHRPIDRFLRSLVEDRRYKSIGVILSGTANDGTLGLEEIKGAGGITFAQDDSAEYPSMPRSATLAGCVDFVLSPSDIGRELARIGSHPYALPAPDPNQPATSSEPALRQILEIVRHATGIDFTHYKRNTIYRRIARRMVLHKVKTFNEYLRVLHNVPSEAKALHQDILINVTSFFRNPEAFEALKEHVFPAFVRDASREDPVRVWILGCSTGEEAYSIAIALAEHFELIGRLLTAQIFASDLSAPAIEKARTGIYAKNLLADVSPERMRRFFVEVDGSYRIAKPIRDMCIFAQQDLLTDPPFSRMDLVACRNVLIYFEPVLQERLMSIMHYALKPNGFLWLGGSETIGPHRELFALIEPKHRIYARKDARSAISLPFTVRRAGGVTTRSMDRPGEGVRSLLEPQKEADRILLSHYVPPSVVVTSSYEILHFRGDTGPYLTPSPGRATLNLLKMLREGLLADVRGALVRAKREEKPVREEGLRVRSNGGHRDVDVQVIPFKSPSTNDWCFLVLFEEPSAGIAARLRQSEIDQHAAAAKEMPASSESTARELARLAQELVSTREYLQSVIEAQESAYQELQSTNEEVQSANEELQSINEELETSKEEIQSSNEELATVNEELHTRNAELFRSNNDIVNLLASVNMPIVMLGADLRIRRFTPAAETLFNLIGSDVGRPISDIKLNLSVGDLDAAILKVIETMTPHEQEVRDKHGRWLLLRVRPYKTVENKIDGAVVVLVDIDQVKRSEALARRHAGLLEQTQVPVFCWTAKGAITYWNRGATETYGFSSEEALGHNVQELLRTAVDRSNLIGALEKTGRWSGELTKYHKSGAPVVVESRMTLLRDGESELVLETNLPITERKQKEEALRERAEFLAQADRSKDEFLAVLAHELRNPLASVRGAVQVLQVAPHDENAREQAENTLDRQTANMVRMVDDLLDVSRVTRGEVHLRSEPVDLNTVLERSLETVQERAAKNSRHVTIELAEKPIYVQGDAMRLEQVFVNLLTNAWKFTAPNGQVWVKARRESGGVVRDTRKGKHEATQRSDVAVVRVRDDGIGMDARGLERVFDLFVQLDRSPKRPTEGLGIGLTLARKLVRLHGGDLQAHSDGPALGSEFIVRLPALAPDFKPAARPRKHPAPSAQLRSGRVLVVDDNSDAAEMIAMLLRHSGHDVEVAHDGPAALVLAGTYEPDIVVLDIGMPGMDGYEIASRLRSIPSKKRLFLIALTGYTKDEDVAAARHSGFDHHFTKPVEVEALLEVVQHALHEQHA
jgi:two-component system CheB/CheR fusion protein